MRKRNEPAESGQTVQTPVQAVLPTGQPPEVNKPQQPAAPPMALPDASRIPRMADGYERIVTTVFDMPDPHEEFQRLRTELELTTMKASQADYGTIVDALDQAEKNAQAAVELLVNFKLAHQGFEMDALATSGPLRERAKDRLEEEKRAEYERLKAEIGSKAPTGKQITEADVAAAVASMFPDEARLIAERRSQAEGALKATESLAARWAERARDLREMCRASRGV